MAIAQVGATQTNVGGVDPMVVNKPTGVVDGNALIAFHIGAVAPALTSGWTSLGSGTDPLSAAFWLASFRVASGDGTTYSFGSGNSGETIILAAYSGNDTTTPFENFASGNISSNATFTTSSISATRASSLWLTFWFDDQGGAIAITSGPAGASQVGTVGSGSVGTSALYSIAQGAGATGAATLTWASNAWGTWNSVILRPPAAGGGSSGTAKRLSINFGPSLGVN